MILSGKFKSTYCYGWTREVYLDMKYNTDISVSHNVRIASVGKSVRSESTNL